MQPPPRGQGPDDDPVVDRIRAWARRPTAEDTVALCDELRGNRDVRGNHVDAVARAIAQRHAKDPKVLLGLGRLQLAVGKLSDAQQTLVSAGRLDASARGPYRYLGEVLLRRGDAARAERMLEKAAEIEARTGEGDPTEEPSSEWLSRARTMRSLQDRQGEGAVAAEMATLLARPGGLRGRNPSRSSLRPPAPVHSDLDDEPTQVGRVPDDLRRRATPGFETRFVRDPIAEAQASAPSTERAAPPSSMPPPLPSSIPPPIPAARAAPKPVRIERAQLEEYSDATTLPRADDSHEFVATGDFLATGQMHATDDMQSTGRMPATAQPTVRMDSRPRVDDDSVPRIRVPTPPPRNDDASPLPQPRPGQSGALRALQADSVTLGEIPRPPTRETAREKPVTNGVAHRALPAEAPGDDWAPSVVLDALERAGIYEPAAAAGSPALWMRRRDLPRTRRRGAWLYALLALVILGGATGGIHASRVLKEKNQHEAEAAALRAEDAVRKSGLDSLAAAEKDLAHAFELDSRTARGMRVWLEDRVLRSHLWPSEDRKEGGLAGAIERAKTVGLTEPELAFARITLALSSDDTPSAVALAKTLDPGAAKDKSDAFRELAVGWVLERAGDARAVDRYAHAVELDPQLVAAKLALAKLAASAGDVARVEELTKDVTPDLDATRKDLVALAALVKDGTAGQPGPKEARRPAGFGWIAHAVALADTKLAADARKQEASRAFSLAREPGDLTRVGRLAAAAGDEATASKAALRALEVSPIFPPARALAARLALSVGRPDDAGRALEGVEVGSDPELAALRAWLAYERQDLAAVAKALEEPSVPAEAFERSDLAPVVKPLRYALAAVKRGSRALSAKEKPELQAIAALGELGPLVAFDVAIETGDLALAEAVGKLWGEADVAQRPSRALRLARLARLSGKAEDADRLSKIAVEQGTVGPTALVERVLVLGGLGKGADALALLVRYPLLIADEQPWLRAWATAQAGKLADAKKQVEALKEPDKKAPFAVRRDALLAMAAVSDAKRGKPLAKDLLKERPGDPDVAAMAKVLGVK